MSGGFARAALLALAMSPAACSRMGKGNESVPGPPRYVAGGPTTRAERTAFRETSSYADVVAFLDSLQAMGAPMWRGSIGHTVEDREIPLVILSRPLVSTPEQARLLRRPVIYVQANIHAGEVEGKEALQALIRDLSFAPGPGVLDSVVLLAIPIYNADGNERFAPQSRNRSSQNGPEMVGQRANAQGLDLNRDYVKAEAPETRASLAAFKRWDPDIFVDLHTTNGSYHGYALTYSPSLNPAAVHGGRYARDSLLPVLRSRMRARHGFETFDYGNFDSQDSVENGWKTYDHRPRFGTNYYGLRGRIAILSEAYSHDAFKRRVASTYAFVREILSLSAERAGEIRRLSHSADSSVVTTRAVPLRSVLQADPAVAEVLVESLETAGDSAMTEPGVPRGIRRTGRIRRARIPVYDRFSPVLARDLPSGYSLGEADSVAVKLLRLHGVVVERIASNAIAPVERFVIDSMATAERPFQGHREVALTGKWIADMRTLAAGGYFVSARQPLGILAHYLLEPESDDGLTTWNTFDARLSTGGEYPVLRVMSPIGPFRSLEP